MIKQAVNRFQKRFYLEWVLDRSSQIYNTPLIYEVDGSLDEKALLAALTYFVNRYDIGCRSRFCEENGVIYQLVSDHIEVVLHINRDEQDIDLDAAIEYELDHNFDLSSGPLFRFSLLKRGERSVVLLNFHHIITDATSAIYFIEILRRCYLHFSAGVPLQLPGNAMPDNGGDTEWLLAKNRDDVAFWCNQLSQRGLHVELPRQIQVPDSSQKGASHFFEFGTELTAMLRQFCKVHTCTPFIAITAVTAVVLSKYSGKHELVLNYPVDARPAGAKNMIGCFINNYPLILELRRDNSLLELVTDIKRQRKQAKQYTEFSLTEVVQQLRSKEELTEGNLFNITVVEAYFDDKLLDMGNCHWQPLPLKHLQVAGDLVFAYQNCIDNVRFRLDYRQELFASVFIARLAQSFCWAMRTLIAKPFHPISADAVLYPEMRQHLQMLALNAPQVSAGQDGVLARFCHAANCFPEATALRYRSNSMTYRMLLNAACMIASRLRACLNLCDKGIQPLVGIYLSRKDQTVVAILGGLGCGCAYVPIDPKMPISRVYELIDESGMEVLLTDHELGAGLKDLGNTPMLLYLDAVVPTKSLPPVKLQLASPDQMAYVIYTSGSTGRPKGVMICHGGLGNVVADFIDLLNIDQHARVVGATAVGFDIFGLELFVALCTGACLLLLDDEVADVIRLKEALDSYQPTLLQGTPSFWSLLSMVGWRPQQPLIGLCGGEALSQSLANYLLHTAAIVYQVYGPTETSIWSSRKLLSDDCQYAVIGQPLRATRLYVLDETQALLPLGASGELYIGGDGVGRGYYRQPGLTAERFLPLCPFGAGIETGPLYRTGDRVYWNEENELVYVGRLDFQVKIRGHRVELGEIEYYLNQLSGVSQAAVRAWDTSDQIELTAYIVLEQGTTVSSDVWRAALRKCLPSYMVPQHFQILDSLPKNLNGKINRQVLPKPKPQAVVDIVAPKGELELKLAAIWRQVLKVDSIGVTNHFFELGGHSLLAAQMLIATGKEFGIYLSFGDLLRYPTIREFAAYIAENSWTTETQILPEERVSFPLSLEQRHLYFIDRYEEGIGHSFNLSLVLRLSGDLDVSSFSRALQMLILRHDMLNVHFIDENGQLRQQYEPRILPLLLPCAVCCDDADDIILHTVTSSFDLKRAPLYRIELLQLNEREYLFVFVLPHIIADGWSLNLLRSELASLYQTERQGLPPKLLPLKQHYSTAVARQAAWFTSPDFERSLNFWQNQLADYQGMTLPVDFPPSCERSFRGSHHSFELSSELTTKLKALAQCHHVSLFCCLYCLFALQLRRYCGQNDLVICAPAANRQLGNEQVIGLFVSMLPLRITIDDTESFGSMIQRFSYDSQAALVHQGVPLESIRAAQHVHYGPAHPLLQVVFALQNANERYTLELDGVESEYLEVEDGVAKYELFLNMRETDGRLLANIEYSTDRFTTERIERMGGHFVTLAEQAVCNDGFVGEFDIVTQAEAESLVMHPLIASNEDDSLIGWFRRIAFVFPHAVALQDGEQTMSYSELDNESSTLARRLRSRHQKVLGRELAPESLIGLCFERGMSLIVAMLAILKAGGAYVPLDPHYPKQRLRYILADSNIDLLLSTHTCFQSNGLTGILPSNRCVMLDYDGDGDYAAESLPEVRAEQLAYMMYTSGSTGNPKGVQLSHHNVVRLFRSSAPLFDFSEHDTWCLFHSYAFDFSVWEIWGALLYGARLVIVSHQVSRDPEQFRTLLVQQSVTVLNQTPNAFVRLIVEDVSHKDCLLLRYVIFGGDVLQVATLGPWFHKYGNVTRLVNMYGITETTVHVTFKTVTEDDLFLPFRNDIGRPIQDLTVLILDQHRRLCPVGVMGELYIAGPGLARGYLNQPELTRCSFVSEPRLLNGLSLYKTGDLVRWLDNGNLEYLGRNDYQVKVRGFRVELGELQSIVMRLPLVSNALAVYDRMRDGIVLYYEATEEIEHARLFEHLRQYLPSFMLPQKVVYVLSLPLTSNGKIDRSALEELSAVVTPSIEYVAPNSPREQILAEVWQHVLEVPVLSVYADFFTVGGDSLRVLDVIHQVRQKGYIFSPKDLFRNPTIAQLAPVLRAADWVPQRCLVEPFSLLNAEQLQACYDDGDDDVYPATALQEGMLFHSEFTEQELAYLDVISCRVKGPFQQNVFETVMKRLMEIHSVLRTSFLRNKLGLWQKVRVIMPLPLKIVDLSEAETIQQEQLLMDFFDTERRCRFVLESGSLWRITIHQLHNEFHLTLVCHHAILDGWSVAVLLTQLLQQYDRSLDGLPLVLEAHTLSFRDYVSDELRIRADQTIRHYWQQVWSKREPVFVAPEASTVLTLVNANGVDRYPIVLSEKLQRALYVLVQKQNVALDVILLAAHLQAISRYTGKRDVATGMASHGRLAEDEEHSMLGLFMNSTPCCMTLEPGMSPLDFLLQLATYKADIQPYRNFPLSDIQRDTRRGPLFDTLFNFVNFRVFEQLRDLNHLQVLPGYCYEETNFSLVCQTGLDPDSGELQTSIVYQTVRLSRSDVERFGLFFTEALRELASVMPTVVERAALAALFPPRHWTGGKGTPLGETNIAKRIAIMAKCYPEKIALRMKEKDLSYRQLDAWANTLAHQMLVKHRGMQLTGLRVGLFASRELVTITAMLAIIKLGAAYVPLDVGYPQAYLEQLVQDSKLVCIAGCADVLLLHDWISPEKSFVLPLYSEVNLECDIPPKVDVLTDAGVAYVMYTSGSTGVPKGVMIEHAAIVRLVVETNYISIKPGHVVAQAANLSFDASTFEIWGALLNGATLVLVPQDYLLDGERFEAFLLKERVDILWLTARLFDIYVNTGRASMFRHLSYLLVGGDMLNPDTISRVLLCPNGRPRYFLNGYGPTENTTFTCVHEISEASMQNGRIPIGGPIAHTQVYVLDEMGREVPIGVNGMLYTAGLGLARGYLHADEYNSEAFVELELPDADSATPQLRRLYQTGDIVRWLPNGELIFIGRSNRTIKVSGYLVALDELEAIALSCPGVEQCVVVTGNNERRQLLLYFSSSEAHSSAEVVRMELKQRLPHFMVPAHVIRLPTLPLNRNGKVDLTKLPPPSFSSVVGMGQPLSNLVQQRLYIIWNELLQIAEIGLGDSFFEQGGDSLLAIQLLHQINMSFKANITIVDIFRYPTIEAMAQYLEVQPKVVEQVGIDNKMRLDRLRSLRVRLQACISIK
ncbi:non-ribosomal peptide synthetase [Photorhabdus africana]|uniref:non-ribosomal peptide synthetase n=1 Tax=Photorhabdus africana TaxID=3097554 RepID=UPI002B41030E|nr:non-ribosomal peptide synthetase [Photorhabdus sp. CRI-LC]